ncbi:Luc7-like protein 3 [Cichlidogyrus casuarinus]|uniref:Luc7-like protein 3 n=1 Tax=Cichlidogyrus casuarinus TaxID=1844966 RepID=A0ABD2QI77_9PLAT
MAWASQAALLDELMGRNRNAAPTDKVKEPHWSDDDICKFYICAFCPHELFVNTKSDLGPCTNVHEEKMRDAYLKSSRSGKMGYEEEFAKFLQGLVDECDRRIQRGHDRLKGGSIYITESHTKVGTIDIIKQDKIDALTKRIEELLAQAETLGSEGKVDQAQGVMKLCEQLKSEKANLEGENRPMLNQGKELEVCEICAAFRIKDDAPQRVEEHLAGKMHIGYAKIRDHLREFNEKKAAAAARNSIRYSRDRTPERDHSRKHRSGTPESSRKDSRYSKDRDRSHHGRGHRGKNYDDRGSRHSHDRDEHRSKSSNKREISPFSSSRRIPDGSDY